ARAKRLHDEAGARAALEAGVRCFRGSRTQGYEWVLLGQGFLVTLSDGEGLRRCLEAALESARARANAEDVLAVGVEWVRQIDHATGAALVLEAETSSGDRTPRAWSLANAWKALGDAAAVARVLDRALANATEVDEAVHVARAWASHGDRERAGAATTRAADLAKTANDWLAIGEVAFDASLGENAIRVPITRAEALAQGEDERTRVATAYKVWLGDEESAARVGPRGVAPEALQPPSRGLDEWSPSASALFDWLRTRVTPESIEAIVMADYGMDADKHRAALVDICTTGLVPKSLAWEPHEVLALTRWSEGEETDHHARALSCVLLCLAPSGMEQIVTDGIVLLGSVLELGAEPTALAARFFAWRAGVNTYGDDAMVEDPEALVALALLYFVGVTIDAADPRLDALATSLCERPLDDLVALEDEIVGAMRASLWTALRQRILEPLRTKHPHVDRVLAILPGDRSRPQD
ncbi:MAG TPA: hypothetical protein VF407_11890, partial [Polyangiaceae bacterium]